MGIEYGGMILSWRRPKKFEEKPNPVALFPQLVSHEIA
jgi:hypothetical protein